MTIPIGSIKFGELDAKNEVFQQDRYGSTVFHNAFQVPPRVDLNALQQGAKFFISGQKGCGKTALLLHLKYLLSTQGTATRAILFKSDLTEMERQRVATGQSFNIIDLNEELKVEYVYKINWLWFIYKNLLRTINPSDVFQGSEIVSSLKKLFAVDGEVRLSTFGDLSFSKVTASAKAAINAGPFTGEITAEIEGLKTQGKDASPSEVIDICERYLSKITFNPRKRSALFFDELESVLLLRNRIRIPKRPEA